MRTSKNWTINILTVFVLINIFTITAVAAVTGSKTGFVANKVGLELNGTFAGWLSSAEGGGAYSEVIVEPLGVYPFAHKHILGVKYDDINITAGTGMSKTFYQWIKDTFDHKATRMNGAIIFVDYNNKETKRLNFTNALITEVSFPELDAASKDAARMTVTFAPETTRLTSAKAGNIINTILSSKISKKWLPANFRIQINGLDTTRVNKINAITIQQHYSENTVAGLKDSIKIPANLEYSDIILTTAESHAQDFYDWHDDFVINGNNSDTNEKSGTLEFLSPNLKEVYFTLTFNNIGIFKLAPEKVEQGSENIRRVKAKMYVEEIKFNYSGSAWV